MLCVIAAMDPRGELLCLIVLALFLRLCGTAELVELCLNDDRRDIGHNAIRLIACNVADALIALVLIVVVAEEAVIVRCWKSLD